MATITATGFRWKQQPYISLVESMHTSQASYSGNRTGEGHVMQAKLPPTGLVVRRTWCMTTAEGHAYGEVQGPSLLPEDGDCRHSEASTTPADTG